MKRPELMNPETESRFLVARGPGRGRGGTADGYGVTRMCWKETEVLVAQHRESARKKKNIFRW